MSHGAPVERKHGRIVAYPVAFAAAVLATAIFDRVDDVFSYTGLMDRPSYSDRAAYNPNGPDSKRIPSLGTNAGLIAGFAALAWLRRPKHPKKKGHGDHH